MSKITNKPDHSVKIVNDPLRVSGLAEHPSLVFAVIFVLIFLLHAPLLRLPYFWDEAGYYVPAARDILLNGGLIPHTTVSNAHPPLVLTWIAFWWKCLGYAPLVTRSAMIVVSAFSLLGLFRLAQRAANLEVAVAATVCTALYPVVFAQSSLAQVDLAAAGLTFWGLSAYLEDRSTAVAAWFSLAVLAKETAILAPLALAAWELASLALRRFGVTRSYYERAARERSSHETATFGRAALPARANRREQDRASFPVERSLEIRIVSLLFPILPLSLWYLYHYLYTGYVFGNPEFFRYNVAATFNPLRFILAFGLRLWQAFGYLHLWILTLAMFLSMLWPPIRDNGGERKRIIPWVQMTFFVVIAAYVLALSLIGGAVLARYMLVAVPLVIILGVSTLRRRIRYWPAAIAFITLAFVAAWFWNPPYGFSPEDNLAYRDCIALHEDAEHFLESRYPSARVLTAWPASDELTRPWLGYITRPVRIVRIQDFSLDEMISAADFRKNFEVALVFSTKYEPSHPLLARWRKWNEWKRRFFGYHRDVPPPLAARILGGRIVFSEARQGQWSAVIEVQHAQIVEAANPRQF